jgi:orotate phosphoribosyltransferase
VTRLEALLLERSVQLGSFVLASGARSSYYIDCRRTTMSAEGQVLVGQAGLQAIREAGWDASAVGGLTMGADPVAYAIAAASFRVPPIIDAFSVRKEVKSHGTGRRIEGNFAPGQRVVIVEDVITSGGSALQAAAAVVEAGGIVAGVLALVDREQGGREKIEAENHEVVAITTATKLRLT